MILWGSTITMVNTKTDSALEERNEAPLLFVKIAILSAEKPHGFPLFLVLQALIYYFIGGY